MATEPPRFYKAGNSYSPLDLNKGMVFPFLHKSVNTNQIIDTLWAGHKKVLKKDDIIRRFIVKVANENETAIDNIISFFNDSTVDWNSNTFTFYPEGYQSGAGVSYTVRLISSNLDKIEVKSGLFPIEMELEEELS